MIETKTLNPSGYDSAKSSYLAITSTYPITNAYANTSSTSYAQVQCKTGSRVVSHISLTFDMPDIPSSAIITSVSCKAKSSVSSTSYITSAVMQIYRDTLATGTSVSFRSTTASVRSITTDTQWDINTLNNLTLQFTATRSNKNTSTACYIRIYGAELTITYEYEEKKYTVIVASSGDGTVSPNGNTEVVGGSDFIVNINPYNNCNIKVVDNNIDVTNNVTQAPKSSRQSSVINDCQVEDSSAISGTYYTYAVGEGADTNNAYTNNCYCRTSGEVTNIWYTFALNNIPTNATITNVTCSIKGHAERVSSTSSAAECVLIAKNVAKSDTVSFTSTTNSIITLNSDTCTRQDLDDLMLQFTIGYYGGLVLGATLDIEYEMPGDTNSYTYTVLNVNEDHNIVITFVGSVIHSEIYLKNNGSYTEAQAVYQKQNGTWVKLTKEQFQALSSIKFTKGS